MRERLHGWLDELGIGGNLGHDLLTACTEAFNNAVQYPSQPTRESIDVEADLAGDTLVLVIRDYGHWVDDAPSADRNHHGFPLMRALTTSVDVDRTPTGTTVTLRRHLATPHATSAR